MRIALQIDESENGKSSKFSYGSDKGEKSPTESNRDNSALRGDGECGRIEIGKS